LTLCGVERCKIIYMHYTWKEKGEVPNCFCVLVTCFFICQFQVPILKRQTTMFWYLNPRDIIHKWWAKVGKFSNTLNFLELHNRSIEVCVVLMLLVIISIFSPKIRMRVHVPSIVGCFC
jgi:hypothetical protein